MDWTFIGYRQTDKHTSQMGIALLISICICIPSGAYTGGGAVVLLPPPPGLNPVYATVYHKLYTKQEVPEHFRDRAGQIPGFLVRGTNDRAE